ncbi:hypothetical protein ACFQ4E_04275 [Litorisediminicola beolgyonensis]|uniref:Uncharacterized protein n=1 Tax=Litorisediminicola beolgyonensis TaxID=1173614 RepID=A0ABW3ZEV9_9RHOB
MDGNLTARLGRDRESLTGFGDLATLDRTHGGASHEIDRAHTFHRSASNSGLFCDRPLIAIWVTEFRLIRQKKNFQRREKIPLPRMRCVFETSKSMTSVPRRVPVTPPFMENCATPSYLAEGPGPKTRTGRPRQQETE